MAPWIKLLKMTGILFIPVLLFIVLPAKMTVDQMDRHSQDKSEITKSHVTIINKVVWNDVIVTYNTDTVSTDRAKKIFRVRYEKYSSNLKSMDIDYDNWVYKVTLCFDDNSQLTENI